MAKKPSTKRPKKQKSRARKIWGRIGMTVLILFIVVGLSGVGTVWYLYQNTDLPDPHSDFQTNTTFIYYGDGSTQLGSLAVQNRVSLAYEDMPQLMKDAVVAAENRSFWTDPGFSASGIARSVWAIASGGELQGGSTITQQYIKILYLDSGQRLSRKINELFLATKMGREMSKEQILEGYLNTIYFGRGAYGIQAAAKSYFLKDASKLTLPEVATLAAILNNPEGLNPSGGEENRARLLERYQYVLDGMLELGNITEAEHSAAYPKLPEFPEVPINNRYGGTKGFLIKQVEDELLAKGFEDSQIQGGGLKIVTTIDKDAQAAAIKVAQSYPKQAVETANGDLNPDDLHVSIASVDTATGGLLAVYGGADYVKNSRNWARTDRPAASTFKTFATIAGLRNGFSLNSQFNGNTFTPRGDSTTIRNEFSHQYGSAVTLRKATADSINTAFVDMTQQISDGPKEVVKAANDAGAPTSQGWDLNNRIALGAAEVSPVNMANAYATLANSGQRNEAHIVKEVYDSKGELIYEAKGANEQTIERNVAANVTDSLTSVVSEGTGTRASQLGRPVAGKTGTNGVDDTITSAWFVGYTKQVSTAVMYVAGDSGNEDLDEYKRPWDGTFFGSSYPLMTWVDFMTEATAQMPIEEFDEPERIRADRRSSQDDVPRPTNSQSNTWSPSAAPSPTQTPATSTPSATASVRPTATADPTTPTAEPTPTTQNPNPTTTAPTQPTTDPEPTKTTNAPVDPPVQPTQTPTTQPPATAKPTQPAARPDATAEAD